MSLKLLQQQALKLENKNADQTANGNVCSRPSKQSFKCAVYKNGELVTSTTY